MQYEVILFKTSTCAVCSKLEPVLKELMENYPSIVYSVELDNIDLMRKNFIRSVPTIMLKDNDGSIAHIINGVVPTKVIEEKINDLITGKYTDD